MGAVLGLLALTLSDWASRLEPGNEKIAVIIEILNETNEVLQDMVFAQGNLVTGHVTTVRTGLPSVAWRILNYGIPQSKSSTVQVTDTCGMLEAYCQIDKRLADLNGNTNEFRLSEDVAFIEAMNQEMCSTLWYGNTEVDPSKFLGLSPRYDDTTAPNGENIIDAGGTGSDLTSIWLIVWGERTIHGMFPKGSTAGLKVEDLTANKQYGDILYDSRGYKYQGYITHYAWDLGLCLRDWRYVVRIANIDITTLSKKGGRVFGSLEDDEDNGPDLIDLLIQAIETPPNLNTGKAVIYCNKTIRTWLRRQLRLSTNVHLTLEGVASKKVLSFDEVPIRRSDAILNAEDLVA